MPALLMTACVQASPLSIQWNANSDGTNRYHVYQGDAIERVWLGTVEKPEAAIHIADGQSVFIAACHGVLESQPSDGLSFELQESTDLSTWTHNPLPQPTGPRHFTKFVTEQVPQPETPAPNNLTLLPQHPTGLGLHPAPGSVTTPINDTTPAPGINHIPTPWIISHRGGYNVAPEHTMEAYRMCVARGIKFIEPDVQVLPDGTVVVMHDKTITRTTTGTGNVVDQTAETWAQLLNDDGKRLPGWATNLKCPTFDDVLREFGNRVVIVPEAKNTGAGAAIVQKLEQFNIRKDMVIIQSGQLTELAPAVAAGYPCMRMSNTNYAETIAAGIEFTGCGWYETSKIEAATAAGLKVIVWTTQRNADLQQALDAGAIAVFSDDPVYQAGLHRTRHDQFSSNAFYHGEMRASTVTLDSAESALNIAAAAQANLQTILLGWASPVIDPTTFTLQFSIKFTAVSDDSSFSMISVQTTDRPVTSALPESSKTSMNMIMRRDGRLQIDVLDEASGGPSVASSEAPVPSELIALDTWIPYQLVVTPTTISLSRLDLPVSASIDNQQVRGSYLFAGAKGANVKFKSMTITE